MLHQVLYFNVSPNSLDMPSSQFLGNLDLIQHKVQTVRARTRMHTTALNLNSPTRLQLTTGEFEFVPDSNSSILKIT